MKEEQISDYLINGQKHAARKCPPALYIAATPIGNLGDVTLRVLETLAGSDLIACEDTRVTAKLLNHYGIHTPSISYNEHNANRVGPELLDRISSGEAVVLVSDAGTPLVSDPGFRLVQSANEQGIEVVPLPGASASLAALVASGLPTESWRFAGFLPNREQARKNIFNQLVASSETTVFFESPNRLLRSLKNAVEVLGPSRQACVARELTKRHEEVLTSSLAEIVEEMEPRRIRGEVVLIIGPATQEMRLEPESLLAELLETNSVGDSAAEAARLTGLPKKDLYRLALSIKDRA